MEICRLNRLDLTGFDAGFLSKLHPCLDHIGEHWADASYVVGPHRTDSWQFILQVEGTSNWLVDNRSYPMSPGGALAIPLGVNRELSGSQTKQAHFYYCGLILEQLPPSYAFLAEPWQVHKVVYKDKAESLGASYQQLIDEVLFDQDDSVTGIELAVLRLLLGLQRIFFSKEGRSSRQIEYHPSVQRALGLIRMNPSLPWSIESLAKASGLSPKYLAQKFSDQVGCSPHAYLLQVRVERSQQLLRETKHSITEIAYQLGFASSQHFSRTFRRHTQQTPSQYRNSAVA